MSWPHEEVIFDHVRGSDRERIGWIRVDADGGFVAYDLLWRQVCASAELEDAERVLEEMGLRYLADEWWYDGEDGPICVQIVEVHRDRLVVAPRLNSENVAKSLDLTSRITLTNPTDLLRPAI